MLNKIYNEDCIEGIKKIPDDTVDLVIIDPPYLINNNSPRIAAILFPLEKSGSICGTSGKSD